MFKAATPTGGPWHRGGNQGAASAHLEWDSDGQLRAVGGGELYQAPMPEDFSVILPGALTEVTMSFEGNTVRLYTNGKRLYTLDRRFARGHRHDGTRSSGLAPVGGRRVRGTAHPRPGAP
jgi:hypothetical protein